VRAGQRDELTLALKEALAACDGPRMIIADIVPGVRLAA
jgi:hypothetical protein